MINNEREKKPRKGRGIMKRGERGEMRGGERSSDRNDLIIKRTARRNK